MTTAESTTAAPKPRRRWFQFSLRTLMVLATLSAIACGWYADRVRRAKQAYDAGYEMGWHYGSGDESHGDSFLIQRQGEGVVRWLRSRNLDRRRAAGTHEYNEFIGGFEAGYKRAQSHTDWAITK